MGEKPMSDYFKDDYIYEEDDWYAAEDYIKFNKEGNLEKNPTIEYLTKDDFMHFFNDYLTKKPEQFPVGDYSIKNCNGDCDFQGVIHKQQLFCPICRAKLHDTHTDPNEGYDEAFQKWQRNKNFLHNIIINNVIELEVEKLNGPVEIYNEEDYMGEEVIIDEL